jgi:hypothetical protein
MKHERPMNLAFRVHSRLWAYIGPQYGGWADKGVSVMPEFFRSSAIMLMGLTVMAAGFAVVFYG